MIRNVFFIFIIILFVSCSQSEDLIIDDSVDVMNVDAEGRVLDSDAEIEQDIKETAKKLDTSFCDNMDLSKARDSCLLAMVPENPTPEICLNMNDIHAKDECYRSIAFNLGDSEYCEEISVTEQGTGFISVDDCYSYVGTKSQDADACSLIGDLPLKEMCYYNVATKTLDKILCDETGFKKDYCIQAIEDSK